VAEHKYAIATSGINPPVIYRIINNEWTNISNSNDIEMQELVNLGNAYDANQAEIKRLREALRSILPHAQENARFLNDLGKDSSVIKLQISMAEELLKQ
jgi:hypothetical protein